MQSASTCSTEVAQTRLAANAAVFMLYVETGRRQEKQGSEEGMLRAACSVKEGPQHVLLDWRASAMSPARSVHALIRLRKDKQQDLRLFHPMREALLPRHLLEQGTPQS
jgi:hypothetical protein